MHVNSGDLLCAHSGLSFFPEAFILLSGPLQGTIVERMESLRSARPGLWRATLWILASLAAAENLRAKRTLLAM